METMIISEADYAALRDRLARAEATICDLRAHVAEQGPLFERRGQIIEEQRIALARAEGALRLCDDDSVATYLRQEARIKALEGFITRIGWGKHLRIGWGEHLATPLATPTDGAARAGDAALPRRDGGEATE